MTIGGCEVASIKTVGGEKLTRRQGFEPLGHDGAVDITQTDMTKVGGLSEQRRPGWTACARPGKPSRRPVPIRTAHMNYPGLSGPSVRKPSSRVLNDSSSTRTGTTHSQSVRKDVL